MYCNEVQIEIRNTPKEFIKGNKSVNLLKGSLESTKEEALWVNSNKITEEIACDVFRSLCPVTGQPDWATIRINYSGKHINYRKLLKYLLSYRNMQAFHEECVEKIFVDITEFCKPDHLTVTANYMRRGGIELNPLRSSIKEFNREILREIKQ